jgi:hypothetical protein
MQLGTVRCELRHRDDSMARTWFIGYALVALVALVARGQRGPLATGAVAI